MKISLLDNRSIIEVSGEDACKFLQSIISNDINLATEDGVIYTYFLNPKGRFLFDVFIYYNGSGYILDINSEHSEKLFERLSFYKLNSKVKISINSDLRVLYSNEQIKDHISHKDPRFIKLGFRSLVRNSEINLYQFHDTNIYIEDKYNYCIPDGFVDLIPEKSLPPEFGCEELNAVSYTKGCYTGQEVISRTKYLGEVRKSLYILNFDNLSIFTEDADDEVIQNGNKIGKVTSYFNKKAIAILRKDEINISHECIHKGCKAKIIIPEWKNIANAL
jgi:folate-binding protein YgfZ